MSISRAVVVLIAVFCVASARAERPPNVILIVTDDQGYGDLSCYGHPTIRTPHIDALAAGGMKMTQFYTASPVCSPSRVAFLTGCYPKRVGMHEHVIFPPYDYGLHPDEVTIADMLRDAGYATGCFGKWHLGHRGGLMPTDQGFDVFFGVPYSNDMAQMHRRPNNTYPHRLPLMRDNEVIEWEPDQRQLTTQYTDEAIKFIDARADLPFFVYLPHSMPHIPLYVPQEIEGTSPRGLYGDVIEDIDRNVGRLVATLEKHRLLEDTLILFTSDNGPWLSFKQNGGTAGSLRDGKGTNWEGGHRVPMVAHWPRRIPAGSICTDVVTAMDVLPTIASLAGAELTPNGPIDGHDITPQLQDSFGADSPYDHVLYYSSRGKLAAIRRGPWKLMLESGALFHVEHDISEKWNVAEQHPERVKRLAALAQAHDRRITAEARPVFRSDEVLFETRKPEQ